ncbi:MAG: NYN domain-containing protein [Coriobacteriales bacterium]|jgi:predicted RNA-binding protein with PIN domain|nr:NYN domain-containing protein [Coriobacteriales bacterium]
MCAKNLDTSKPPLRILVVDGYNVLRSSGMYDGDGQADFSHEHYNKSREALISDVAVFAHRRFVATVVFDGGGNPSSTGNTADVAGVRVVFSAAGVSADTVIEEEARAAADDGHEVLVVTSDAATQWTVFSKKVTRMSALGFADEMRALKTLTHAELERTLVKRTLGERLDETTRERLARMARGQE